MGVTIGCSYCHRAGHAENDCWKKQRDRLSCAYCSKRRHELANCWTKQNYEEEKIRQWHRVKVLQEKDDSDKNEPEIVAAV